MAVLFTVSVLSVIFIILFLPSLADAYPYSVNLPHNSGESPFSAVYGYLAENSVQQVVWAYAVLAS